MVLEVDLRRGAGAHRELERRTRARRTLDHSGNRHRRGAGAAGQPVALARAAGRAQRARRREDGLADAGVAAVGIDRRGAHHLGAPRRFARAMVGRRGVPGRCRDQTTAARLRLARRAGQHPRGDRRGRCVPAGGLARADAAGAENGASRRSCPPTRGDAPAAARESLAGSGWGPRTEIVVPEREPGSKLVWTMAIVAFVLISRLAMPVTL